MKTLPSKMPGKTRRPRTTTPTPPKIMQILATTDFSDASRCGVRYAVSLAEKFGAAVALIHVVEPRTWLTELGALLPLQKDSDAVASAQAQLATLVKREAKSQVPVACSVSVRAGNPFHAITTAALERAVDLIVVATNGRTGAERFLLGSTAERVVRHASCPVLTVPFSGMPHRIGKPSPLKLRKILIPVDFSKLSEGALPWAQLLAARFRSEIVLLHVVEIFPIDYIPDRERGDDPSPSLTKIADDNLKLIARSLSESVGTNVPAIIREGNPSAVICETARTLGADLIIQTTHGYTGLKHVFLGSTAERVVRDAHCPVLTVRKLDGKKL